MRHLAIAANTLIAVDGNPDIKAAALTYPHQLPAIDTVKLVRLLPFGEAYWNQGIAIEQPDSPKCPPSTTGEYRPDLVQHKGATLRSARCTSWTLSPRTS
ncbi:MULTISPECIES: ferritin-like protein [Streptomyces]|uniref:ferritin-like protein n=1 Tax=Streptomyces lycopersici TaxID=2974589 RepID=UPI0021CF13CD|nr:ferritin-like protein [Streptomyces sp. NEAU-383]